MKRLAVDQDVALSVGDATIDCRVAALTGGEAALEPLVAGDSRMLPAASAGASLVFTHEGRLVMLRGALYRASGDDDLRFAEKTVVHAKAVSAEQRRKAARLAITLPATLRQLDADGTPGEGGCPRGGGAGPRAGRSRGGRRCARSPPTARRGGSVSSPPKPPAWGASRWGPASRGCPSAPACRSSSSSRTARCSRARRES